MSQFAFEFAKNIIDGIPGINTKDLYIWVKDGEEYISVEYRYKNSQEQQEENGVLVSGEVETMNASVDPEAKGVCYDAHIVKYSNSSIKNGWGRFLYYIAMHFAGNLGITADRVKSSHYAVSVWNNLFADESVEKVALDDFLSPVTPSKEDDCNLASSGMYGKAFSPKSFAWNPMLKTGVKNAKDAETLSAEEKSEKAKHYRDMKASKLNYVYYGSFPEIISMLKQHGKLFMNGENVSEQKNSVILSKIIF